MLEYELSEFNDVFVNGIKSAEKGLIRSLHLDLEIEHVGAEYSRGVNLYFFLVLSHIRIANFPTKHILHMFALNILQFCSQLIYPLPGLLCFVLGSIQKLNYFLFRILELRRVEIVGIQVFQIEVASESLSQHCLLMPHLYLSKFDSSNQILEHRQRVVKKRMVVTVNSLPDLGVILIKLFHFQIDRRQSSPVSIFLNLLQIVTHLEDGRTEQSLRCKIIPLQGDGALLLAHLQLLPLPVVHALSNICRL